MSIKDMFYQMSELRRENDDLKEQVEHFLVQQRWFMQQIDGVQKEYGACYQQLLGCSLELYNVKQELFLLKHAGQPSTCQQQVAVQVQPSHFFEHLGMLQADLESHEHERHFKNPQSGEQLAMLQAEVESFCMERQDATLSQKLVQQSKKQTETLLHHYKTQLDVTSELNAQFEEELKSVKHKVTSEKQQVTTLRKKLKDAQEDAELKTLHVGNQKDTIHRLQNNIIVLSEKLAVTEGMLRESKKEVGIATDLFNEMSVKCGQIKADHGKKLAEMNETVKSLRACNSKMVHKAVEQAKIIKKLNSSVRVTFQVDKETTEEVMREGYSDLQKFIEKKALHMEHTLALVAYALTHLKFVIERFVYERFENAGTGSVSLACDFLNQVINQITRIFLIIPVPIMTRNIDRLTDLAAEHCVSMKALHMIQYVLPATAEEAQASRQRSVLNNHPELSDYFTAEHDTKEDTVTISLSGFMLLIGISK